MTSDVIQELANLSDGDAPPVDERKRKRQAEALALLEKPSKKHKTNVTRIKKAPVKPSFQQQQEQPSSPVKRKKPSKKHKTNVTRIKKAPVKPSSQQQQEQPLSPVKRKIFFHDHSICIEHLSRPTPIFIGPERDYMELFCPASVPPEKERIPDLPRWPEVLDSLPPREASPVRWKGGLLDVDDLFTQFFPNGRLTVDELVPGFPRPKLKEKAAVNMDGSQPTTSQDEEATSVEGTAVNGDGSQPTVAEASLSLLKITTEEKPKAETSTPESSSNKLVEN